MKNINVDCIPQIIQKVDFDYILGYSYTQLVKTT